METDRKQQVIGFIKEYKWILLIAIVFFVAHLFFLDTTFTADEGTHTLISMFYKDLITFAPTHLSVSQIYNYAINYLVYYPKLSVYYPPLFHILGAIFFFVKEGYTTLRLVSLMLGALSLVALYFLTLKFTKNKKMSILASLLLAASPLVNTLSITALTDNALLLAGILVMYLWYSYMEEDKGNKWIITILSLVLVFARQQMVLVFLPLFIYAVLYKKLRKIILPFIIIGAIFGAYYFVLYKLGVLQASLAAEVVAAYEGDPLFTQLAAWTYYPVTLFVDYLVFPISLLSLFGMYKWCQSRERWQILLLILLLSNVLFFIFVPNKNTRFILPAVITMSIAAAYTIINYLNKKVYYVIIALVLIISFGVSISGFYSNKAVSYDFMNYIEKPGNIGIISENGELYSSNIMAAYASSHPMDRIFYRPCAFFDNKTLLNNARYAIVVKPVDVNFKDNYTESASYIEKDASFTKIYSQLNKNISVDVYENNNYTPSGEVCNYICIKQQEICSKL